jgi:hypothetical protein
MPNQRAKGKRLIGTWLEEDYFLDFISLLRFEHGEGVRRSDIVKAFITREVDKFRLETPLDRLLKAREASRRLLTGKKKK